MTEHFLCRECPDHLRTLLPRFWDRERASLERLLVKIPADQRTLRVTLIHEPLRNVARVVLSLPTGKLVAEGVEENAERALHQAADRLIRQVKQHLAQLRREADYRKELERQRPRGRDRKRGGMPGQRFLAVTRPCGLRAALRQRDGRR